MRITKSLFDISWQVPEETYRKDEALSYSTLAKYEREGFSKLGTLFDKVTTPSLTFGSLVDCLITGTKEDFTNSFYVTNISDISETLKTIIQELFNKHPDVNTLAEISDEDIDNICSIFNYGNAWKSITRINAVKTKGAPYFEALVNSKNKTIVTPEEYKKAQECADALRTSKATRFYFFSDPFKSEEEGIERLYQLKFKGEDPSSHIKYRCMLDLVVVDHNNKTIQPIDLKTSSHAEFDFPISFIQWNYQIQARLYYRILQQNVLKDPYFKDFKILPYKFIVVNKWSVNPLVWDFANTNLFGDFDMVGGMTNKPIKMRDPYKIGSELSQYLQEQPKVPIGIKFGEGESNSIENWITRWG